MHCAELETLILILEVLQRATRKVLICAKSFCTLRLLPYKLTPKRAT